MRLKGLLFLGVVFLSWGCVQKKTGVDPVYSAEEKNRMTFCIGVADFQRQRHRVSLDRPSVCRRNPLRFLVCPHRPTAFDRVGSTQVEMTIAIDG